MGHLSSEGTPIVVDCGGWAALYSAIEVSELGDSDGDGAVTEVEG